MKAILIARVSTAEQAEAGNSLPAQIVRLERYCLTKGMTILNTYSFDESAYSNDRSEFDRIIDIVLSQTEKVAICCDKVDRLSRNVFDKRIPVLYEKALQDEIELHFVSDGQVINSRISATEKFQFSISLGLAKYYSDAISDNVKRVQEQMLRNGVWLAKAPYGYKNIKRDDGQADIIALDYESSIIKKVFARYAMGTCSMDMLIKELAAEHNIHWPKGQLGKILNNPFYYGVMLCKGNEYPHRYQPIISKDLFDQVQNIKNAANAKHGQHVGIKKDFLYRNILRCAQCGMSITPEIQKGYRYYHCTQYRGKHGAAWLREEVITAAFEDVFKKLQVPQESLDEITKQLNDLHVDKIQLRSHEFERLAKEQQTLSTMKEKLYFDKLKGSITDTDYDKYYQTIRTQLSDVTTRLAQLEDDGDDYYMTARSVLKILGRSHELFMSSEVTQRRAFIKLVLSNVRVDGENVLYDVQSPFDLIINATDCILWRS